jgi:hypothetical protein
MQNKMNSKAIFIELNEDEFIQAKQEKIYAEKQNRGCLTWKEFFLIKCGIAIKQQEEKWKR